jgi:hypothetical protein
MHWFLDLSIGMYGVSFLQTSPNFIIWFANPQMCETYDLRCPNTLDFALWSKSVQDLHIAPPGVSIQGFPGVF